MAIESVNRATETNEPTLALSINSPKPEHYRELWESANLPMGLDNQLQKIDRAASGLDAVLEILRRDFRCSMNQKEFEGVDYTPLSPYMLEELHAAEESLLNVIRDGMESIRDQLRRQRERGQLRG